MVWKVKKLINLNLAGRLRPANIMLVMSTSFWPRNSVFLNVNFPFPCPLPILTFIHIFKEVFKIYLYSCRCRLSKYCTKFGLFKYPTDVLSKAPVYLCTGFCFESVTIKLIFTFITLVSIIFIIIINNYKRLTDNLKPNSKATERTHRYWKVGNMLVHH